VDDESALVHLAQMASAAVERARLYHERAAEDD
jgi:GAF domain-containing protein